MKKAVSFVFVVSLVLGTTSVAKAACTKDQVIKSVDKACALVVAKGEKAFEELMKPEFNGACESYVWIHEVKSKDSVVMIFHPVSPGLMGQELIELKDPKGKPIFRPFVKLAGEKGKSGWTGYHWNKAGVDGAFPKCSFVKNCDGKLAAGMGIYADCKKLGVTSFE